MTTVHRASGFAAWAAMVRPTRQRGQLVVSPGPRPSWTVWQTSSRIFPLSQRTEQEIVPRFPKAWSKMAGKKGTAGPRSGLSATSIRAWQAGDSAWSAPQPGRDQRPQRSRCPASSAYRGNLSSMEMSVASCVSAVAIISRSWGSRWCSGS